MNNEYRLVATPKIIEVVCPKHRCYMQELSNGFLSNPVWWCVKCDYPYSLRPVKMREFNRENVELQLKEANHER